MGSAAPPRKVLTSLGLGAQEALLEIAAPTFAALADGFGYELDLRTRAPEHDRPPAWGKVLVLLELLERNDVVVWIDADAVVVDASADPAGALAPGATLGLVEHRIGRDRIPNTGVMVVRGGEAARRFWSRVWAHEEYVDHPWWENAAVCDLLGYRLPTWPRVAGAGFRDWPRGQVVRHAAWHLQCQVKDRLGLEILPVRPNRGAPPPDVTLLDRAWNSIPADPSPAPRIRHYPGEPLERRAVAMRGDVASRRARAA